MTAPTTPPATERWDGRTFRHKKRGTVYRTLGLATVQVEGSLVDDGTVVVYQGDDGLLWCRPPEEFQDGRFVEVPTRAPSSPEGDTVAVPREATEEMIAAGYGERGNRHPADMWRSMVAAAPLTPSPSGGAVVVPREPTPEMLRAALIFTSITKEDYAAAVWQRMYDAFIPFPLTPAEAEEVDGWRSIETAPAETLVLVLMHEGGEPSAPLLRCLGWKSEDLWFPGEDEAREGDPELYTPVGWAPLPALPVALLPPGPTQP